MNNNKPERRRREFQDTDEAFAFAEHLETTDAENIRVMHDPCRMVWIISWSE